MKRILWLFLSLILLLGTYPYSMAESAKLTLLKNIDVVTSVDNTKIELRFNGIPNEKGVSYHENFMQLEFSDTYVDPAKQWINVEDEIVKNIFLYQLDATTVRARFFTFGKAGNLKDKISFIRGKDKISILYNVTSGEEKPVARPAEKIAAVKEKNAGRAVAARPVAIAFGATGTPSLRYKSEPPLDPETFPSAAESAKLETPPSVSPSKTTPEDKPLIPDAAGSPDLYASLLKMILALGLLLALLFAGVFMFKKFMGNKIGIAGQNPSIKVITSAYIGAKKSIALVDISGERIVVGITPNHISMLARLGKEGEFGNILKEQMSSNDKVELNDDLWEKV